MAPTKVSGSIVAVPAQGRGVRFAALSVRDAGGRRLPSQVVLKGQHLLLKIRDGAARYPVTVEQVLQDGSTIMPEEQVNDGGLPWQSALSTDGSTAVVAAPGAARLRGRVWVFARVGGVWLQRDELIARGVTDQANFGSSVAISADGQTILVGAPKQQGGYTPHGLDDGAAWVFTRAGSDWVQQGEALRPADGQAAAVGQSVALSADGQTAMVAGYGTWPFVRSAGVWRPAGPKLSPTDGGDELFQHVAMAADGSTAIVGTPGEDQSAGAARIFVRGGAGWRQQGGRLVAGRRQANTRFGEVPTLSANGSTALISGGRSGWLAQRTGSTWTKADVALTPADSSSAAYASSVALAPDGQTAIVGNGDASRRGGWLFARKRTGWDQDGPPLTPTTAPSTIGGVAVQDDGSSALIAGQIVDRKPRKTR